jgi:hypothetical protein
MLKQNDWRAKSIERGQAGMYCIEPALQGLWDTDERAVSKELLDSIDYLREKTKKARYFSAWKDNVENSWRLDAEMMGVKVHELKANGSMQAQLREIKESAEKSRRAGARRKEALRQMALECEKRGRRLIEMGDDGNCFTRAVSRHLWGTQAFHDEVCLLKR